MTMTDGCYFAQEHFLGHDRPFPPQIGLREAKAAHDFTALLEGKDQTTESCYVHSAPFDGEL